MKEKRQERRDVGVRREERKNGGREGKRVLPLIMAIKRILISLIFTPTEPTSPDWGGANDGGGASLIM